MREAGHCESGCALVFACDSDDAYARGLAVAIYSAVRRLDPDFRPEICVLDNGLSESSRTRLLRVAQAAGRIDDLRLIPIPTERLQHLEQSSPLGSSTYARLVIGELISSHVRRAVYLDTDVLVKRDLAPLFAVELGDAPIAAVRNFGTPGPVADRDPGSYFNAGVLVLDLPRWRAARIGERTMQYAGAPGESLVANDQDALNIVVGNWHELDFRWNVQHGDLFVEEPPPNSELLIAQREQLCREAAILHFTGSRKPWFPWCRMPGTMAWVTALMGSGWYTPRERLSWLLPWLGRRAAAMTRSKAEGVRRRAVLLRRVIAHSERRRLREET